jgi:hypothetical protein
MNRGCASTLLLLLTSAVIATAGAQKVSVGIAPVFDGGGEAFGPVVVQHLTLFSYEDLLKSPVVSPSLLSPGGVYSPLDTSWLVDYVHDRTDIKVLLVATLKRILNPDKKRWVMPIDLTLLDASSGDSLASWTITFEISSWKTLTDYGAVVKTTDLRGNASYADIAPSRRFEKQPLGKATAHLAKSVRESLEEKLTTLGLVKPLPQASADVATLPAPTPLSCPLNVKITYAYKHSASHAYMLLANGLDQSTNLKEGVANFSAPEGELLLQFSVKDAPYKLEKEDLYQLSTQHSCKSSNLNVDLGPGGDAHALWQ